MGLVWALWVMVARWTGRIVNLLFGWAVEGLFGRTPRRDQTLLCGLMALAVSWPLCVLELLAPRPWSPLSLAALPGVRSFAVRLVWLALVAALPATVGLMLATRAPTGVPMQPAWKSALSGLWTTLGFAAAFLWMLLVEPIRQIAALMQRRETADVLLLTAPRHYFELAAGLSNLLARHGVLLERRPPHWSVGVAIRLLNRTAGNTLSLYLPPAVEHFAAPGLEVFYYPNSIRLSGQPRSVAGAQAILSEGIIETNSLETTSPPAQALERRIRAIWQTLVLDGPAAEGLASPVGLAQVVRELADLDVDADQWRALYRQVLQVERALEGKPQILEAEAASTRTRFDENAPTVPALFLPDADAIRGS